MRILFLPIITRGAAIGTITRCLAIADELRLLGHECFFLTNGEGAKHVAEGGYSYMEGVVPDAPGSLTPLRDLSEVAVHLNLTKEDYLRHALAAEQRAVEQFRPDVLFSEFKLTAAITAGATGIPLVSTACSPADQRFVSDLFEPGRSPNHDGAVTGFNRILDEHGQAPVKDVSELFFTRSRMKIAPTIQELEPLLADVPDLHYVGYLLYDRWELAPLSAGLIERTRAKQVVFVYLGSGEIGPDSYTRVLPEAFDKSEFHAVVAVGDHPRVPELPESTSNITWVRFVPGRSMLRCSQAVIFHGGQNTAMSAIMDKVPSLVFPGHDFERYFNARSIERVGAGLCRGVQDFTPAKVLDTIRELRNPAYAKANETYGRKILRQGGPRRAAELIREAVSGLPESRKA